ncbi:MAG: rhomboid family intramembrane serine protease [Fibromonadaceae bacterium]|jgi:membrane associated rhomboid family serine protease|nr:rhomboid family intramembrane serine protease [Fibromonadaceae bacterium]
MLGLTPFKYLPRPMQTILLLNAAVFVLSMGFAMHLLVNGAFIPSRAYQLWRFLSYAFIHLNFMHFLINMLMFWMFAAEVCKTLGERNFTVLYLLSAIFAGVFSLAFYTLGITGPNPIIGASGALFGVMAAYAFLFPERHILMFFIIPMKIKYAVWIFIAISLFMADSGDGIAHYTHLGGIISGYLFMLFWSKKVPLESFFAKTKQQQTHGETHRPLEGELYKGGPTAKEERLNEILEKINSKGLHSLNQEERDYLQWFGQQNKKRG